jgi:hypothetical protein
VRYDPIAVSILRLIVACLVMAALPVQGIAAASMLFCGKAAHSTAQEAAHDHAGHASHASHGDEQATHAHEGQGGGIGGDHACPICASCCNLVAVFEASPLGLDPARPAAPPLQGPARVLTREASAPDKPPRA